MNQPSEFAKAIAKSIREIAARRNVSLEEAADIWMEKLHRRAEEIRQR